MKVESPKRNSSPFFGTNGNLIYTPGIGISGPVGSLKVQTEVPYIINYIDTTIINEMSRLIKRDSINQNIIISQSTQIKTCENKYEYQSKEYAKEVETHNADIKKFGADVSNLTNHLVTQTDRGDKNLKKKNIWLLTAIAEFAIFTFIITRK